MLARKVNHRHLCYPGSAVAGAARVVARAGGNISVACGGVSSSSYIYLVEWVCSGCSCAQCPAHSNTGLRLLRYNDKITQVSCQAKIFVTN